MPRKYRAQKITLPQKEQVTLDSHRQRNVFDTGTERRIVIMKIIFGKNATQFLSLSGIACMEKGEDAIGLQFITPTELRPGRQFLSVIF